MSPLRVLLDDVDSTKVSFLDLPDLTALQGPGLNKKQADSNKTAGTQYSKKATYDKQTAEQKIGHASPIF